MTYREIFDAVALYTDKDAIRVQPGTRTRINGFINARYREIMRTPGVSQLRDETFTFTTTANRSRYALPGSLRSIVTVFDSANRIYLKLRSLAWIRQRDPSIPPQISGTPWVFAILNQSGVGLQQSTPPVTLELVSTSSLDTFQVELEYQDSDGGFRVGLTTLNGLTPVTVSPTPSQVFRITSLVSPQGTISLRRQSDAAVMAQIGAASLVSSTGPDGDSDATIVQLWPMPAGAYTYQVDGERRAARLVDDQDVPAFSEDFHDLLVWGATCDEFTKMDDTRRADFKARWDDGVKKLRASLHNASGQTIIPTGGRPVRPLDGPTLGPWYPIGS